MSLCKGGGIAVHVNNRLCNPEDVTVKHRFYSQYIEQLAMSFHPYYLQKEFTSVTMVVFKILRSAGADAACDVISSAVAKLQTQQPTMFKDCYW